MDQCQLPEMLRTSKDRRLGQHGGHNYQSWHFREPRPTTRLRHRGPRGRRAKDSIRRSLTHSGRDISDHYIRDSALGQLQLAEQETISAYILDALRTARGLI